jgi:hypothetical protein
MKISSTVFEFICKEGNEMSNIQQALHTGESAGEMHKPNNQEYTAFLLF